MIILLHPGTRRVRDVSVHDVDREPGRPDVLRKVHDPEHQGASQKGRGPGTVSGSMRGVARGVARIVVRTVVWARLRLNIGIMAWLGACTYSYIR